jgi:hypothetical protein
VLQNELGVNNRQWVYTGHGVTWQSGTAFTLATDQTSVYESGRRLKIVGPVTGTIYGDVSSATFSATTAVNLRFDAGVLSNETLDVYVSPLTLTNSSIPFSSERITPQNFGVVEGASEGSATATTNATGLQAFFDYQIDVGSGNAKPFKWIPAGDYLYDGNLTITDVDAGQSPNQGYQIVQGEGIDTTVLRCSSSSGDALSVQSGYVHLSHFSIRSDGTKRSESVGSGNGLVIKPETGTTHVTHVRLEHLRMGNQPGHGQYCDETEMVTQVNCIWSTNGLDGYHHDDDGFNNVLIACRAISNGQKSGITTANEGRGLTNKADASAFINVESLNNLGDDHVFDGGAGTTWHDPDIENLQANIVQGGGATDFIPTGMRMVARRQEIKGGTFVNFEDDAIKLSGEGQRVINPNITNALVSYACARGVNTSLATNYTVELDRRLDAVTVTNITQATPGVVTAAGHNFSNGDTVYLHNVVGMVEVNYDTNGNVGYTVANSDPAAGTFDLGISTAAYSAYASGGNVDVYPANVIDGVWSTSGPQQRPHDGGQHRIEGVNQNAGRTWTRYGAGALSVDYDTVFIETDGADAITIPTAHESQVIQIIMTVDAGDATITRSGGGAFGSYSGVSNNTPPDFTAIATPTTIVLANAGDWVKVQYSNNEYHILAAGLQGNGAGVI